MSTEAERQRRNRIGLWRDQITSPHRDPLTPLDALLDSFEADVRADEREVVASAATEREAELRALADEWRYKGEFGWGAWQEGQGPDIEGQILDECASKILRVLDRADTEETT